MDRFLFWQKWLLLMNCGVIGLGILMVFFQGTILLLPFDSNINPQFFGSITVTMEIQAFQFWIYGVLGATIIGWGIFGIFLTIYPFKNKERWAWLCIAVGISTWFIIDTILSLYYGVLINVVLNITIFLGILMPLVFTWKEFFTEHHL